MATETNAKERYFQGHDLAQEAAYQSEHWLAWLLAAGGIVLGLLGLLTAFQILELRDYGPDAGGIQTPAGDGEGTGVDVGGGQGQAEVGGVGISAQSVNSESFWDGMLLITTGISASLLAYALHHNEHHRSPRRRTEPADSEASLWNTEHGLAYLAGLGTLALGTTALLTGFDAFGADTDQLDGMIWAFCSLGAAVLTNMFHTVRHHQTVAEEDYMVRLVEDRVGTTTFTSSPGYTGEAAYQPGSTRQTGRGSESREEQRRM
jgi:hypothetical protein